MHNYMWLSAAGTLPALSFLLHGVWNPGHSISGTRAVAVLHLLVDNGMARQIAMIPSMPTAFSLDDLMLWRYEIIDTFQALIMMGEVKMEGEGWFYCDPDIRSDYAPFCKDKERGWVKAWGTSVEWKAWKEGRQGMENSVLWHFQTAIWKSNNLILRVCYSLLTLIILIWR